MPKPSGDEWEYLVEHRQVTVDDLLAKDVPGHTQAYLNDHGDEGWELVQVLLDDSGRGLGACPVRYSYSNDLSNSYHHYIVGSARPPLHSRDLGRNELAICRPSRAATRPNSSANLEAKMTRKQWIFIIGGAVLLLALSCCITALIAGDWAYSDPEPQVTRVPTAEPLPTFTPALVPTPAEIVELVSERLYVDDYGYVHLVGEIRNISNRELSFVQVIVTFYDADMNVALTDYTYADIETIQPGGMSPFELVLLDDVTPGVDFATYTVQFQD
jgi:hypothetical protein